MQKPRGVNRMTIRSVDMQVLLPRATEVARMQQAQRMEHVHRQFDNKDAIVQQTFNVAKHVNNTNKSEKSYIEEAPEKKEKRDKQQKQGQKDRDESSDNEQIKIDITV